MYRIFLIISGIFLLGGCATHTTVSPLPLKKDQTYTGIFFSAENVFPVLYHRRGLSDKWDLGLRIGLPLYGTGIDVSRLLSHSEKRSDVFNLAFSANPNYNLDYTYYRIRHKVKVNKKRGYATRRLRYVGLRGMVIFNGITGGRSNRFGILIGGGPSVRAENAESLPAFHKYQWEIGYYHDFKSMPINEIFTLKFESDLERFEDYPHSRGGFPTEFSRLTGLSLRVSFPIGASKPKPYKRPQKASKKELEDEEDDESDLDGSAASEAEVDDESDAEGNEDSDVEVDEESDGEPVDDEGDE
jgi:hypothetical protein